jgi:hypothetical protein
MAGIKIWVCRVARAKVEFLTFKECQNIYCFKHSVFEKLKGPVRVAPIHIRHSKDPMSVVYYCDKKLLRKAARAYAYETSRSARRAEFRTKPTVPFCMDKEYSWQELMELERKHTDWFLDCLWLTNSNTNWWIPYCAWCYEERGGCEDDNEHEECDLRLHYCSEAGKAEQAAILTKQVIPRAPAVVIAQIMAFL